MNDLLNTDMDEAVPQTPELRHLVWLVSELQETPCLDLLRQLLDQGHDPHELLACFMEGMRLVGEHFENGRYFIAALIMAGEIMRVAMEMLSPHLVGTTPRSHGGKIIMGTIQGDIHDLGKNLFAMLLSCHNFEIIDLGVDVAPERFLESARGHQPDVIAMSCVLTTSVPSLKEAVALLRAKMPPPVPPIIVGGTCVDEQIARYVGADFWAANAALGLKICQRLCPPPSAG